MNKRKRRLIILFPFKAESVRFDDRSLFYLSQERGDCCSSLAFEKHLSYQVDEQMGEERSLLHLITASVSIMTHLFDEILLRCHFFKNFREDFPKKNEEKKSMVDRTFYFRFRFEEGDGVRDRDRR